MRFSSIGSGSKGNSTIIEHDDTVILVDCGFSLKETEKRLSISGLAPSKINAILVTHEHSDHIRGVSALAKKYEIPVMATAGTSKFLRNSSALNLTCIDTQSDFHIENLTVTPVLVPHDAREPVQFIIRGGLLTFGILTDVGAITEHIIELYQCCDGLMIESNHDEDMLLNGSYPRSLKNRVSSNWGHLNNKQMLYFLKNIELEQLQELVIGHISENNNSVALVKETISEISKQLLSVSYATQNEGFDWIQLKS
jgi:phosphoribosyl 1,2-cyclic phosphodiesterase